MTGESHWSINPAPSVIGLLKTGKVRAIGQTLPKRTPLLPDMPAIAEAVPGYSYSAWNGIIAPRATPASILVRLREAVGTVMNRPDTRAQMAAQATEILVTTPEEFRRMVQETITHNVKLVRALGLTAD